MTGTIPPGSARPSLANDLDKALGEEELTDGPTVFFVGLSGNLAGKLFKIRAGESLIGRSSRAFICLDQKAVSHKHAALTLRVDGCSIEDLDSTNGTFVNEERISSPRPLMAGDVIRIGNNAFGFLTDADDETQHTRAMARLTSPRMSQVTLPPPPSLQGERSNRQAGLEAIVPTRGIPQQTSVAPIEASAHYAEEEGNALDNALDKLDLAVNFLKRYWLTLVVCALLGAAAGVSIGLLRPPLAYASFEIYLRQEATPDPERQQQQRDLGLQGGEFFAFAERKFSDPELIVKSLAALSLPEDRALAKSISQRLSFAQVDRMGTFRGSFLDSDRAFAERFLAAHLQTFLEAEINKSLKVQASEVSLMRQEFERNEEELDRVEQRLKDFKEHHLQALPENAQAQIQAKGSLLAQRDRVAADVSRYSSELALARQKLESQDGLKLERSRPYEGELTDLKSRIASAEASGLTSEHPEMVRLLEKQKRLLELRDSALNAEPTEDEKRSSVAHQNLRQTVDELTVRLGASREELGLIESRLGEIASISSQMPEVEADIARLMRNAETTKEIHERLHLELKAKELELKFERASVAARYEIMSPPSAQQPPRSKSVVKFGSAGTGAGLALGIVIGLAKMVVGYARKRKTTVTPPQTSAISRIGS